MTAATPTEPTRLVGRDGASLWAAPAAAAPRGEGPPAGRTPHERPTWAEVDLGAIAHNVAALSAHAPAPLLLAAVKADGYGHGLVPAGKAALRGGADWLGVALVEEARALRAAGVEAPVLLFSEPPPVAVGGLLDADATPTVYSPALLAALDAEARRRGVRVGVHLKLDTGMRRVGVPEAQWHEALEAVRDARHLLLQGLWSHLAVADETSPDAVAFTDGQAAAFRRGLALARRLGLEPEIAHLCNSAGTLTRPDDAFDMVRLGIAVYGISPAPGLADGAGLRPALRWRSELSLVKRVVEGETVSYGRRWAAPRDTLVGTVPVGYGDGVSRRRTNRGHVLHGGRRVPIVGTVCMDQLLVDLGDGPASEGDEVVLIGRQGEASITAEEVAEELGTIGYEVVCGISARVPRTYVGGAGVQPQP